MTVQPFIKPVRENKGANDSVEKMRVLVADDDSDALRYVAEMVEWLGHKPVKAGNGKEVLELLRAQGSNIDVMYLDATMPYIGGAALVNLIAHDPVLRQIPVIMQCDEGEEFPRREDLFYLLRRPCDELILSGILSAAIRQAQKTKRLARRAHQYRAGFSLMQAAKFNFRTLDEAENLACFVANFFPDPEHVVTGLAELMVNAIEHGNLRIGELEKEDLVRRNMWREEIEKRLAHPDYKDLRAEIAVTRRDSGIYVLITDQGDGFAWQNYVRINPERAARACGRGIAHAATVCFDLLRYDQNGNTAVAFTQDRNPLRW